MGSEQNRRLHRIPHSLIYGLVIQKAWVRGMAALEFEESYTSQSSFAHGDLLRIHPEQAAKKSKAKIIKAITNTFSSTTKPTTQTAEPQASGARGVSGGRHRFSFAKQADTRPTSPTPPRPKPKGRPMLGQPSKSENARETKNPKAKKAWPSDKGFGGIHADLNGAYNIGHKACPLFAYGAHLSLAIRIRSHASTPEAQGWRPVQARLKPRKAPAKTASASPACPACPA